jgi:DNA primase
LISKETIEQILIRNDIESLIGSYVSLKRAGSNLKGLCPFHSEKSPSFTVYPQDNSFYCFGCGAGGDAITFVRKRENLDYPDAVEFLANRAGITIVRDERGGYQSTPKFDRARMFKMNADAARYFHQRLFDNTPESKNALAYFTEGRKLSLATIKHFGLGYAPNSFDKFSKYMRDLGYTYEELVAGFLCGKNEERGTYFDAFRNRVMFPIIDVAGNVIAFGGRVLDDSKPKYKNSSDTPVFKKSRNLFALNFARLSGAESMILCEGYMDVIAMHAAGFTNAIATLGTAITAEQARMLSRYTKKVIISYDADEAGQKAAMRAVKLLSDVGLDVTILKVPGAKDPDEYINTFGKEKFKEVLNESKTKFEYHMENILSKYDINLSQDKVKALYELEKVVSEIYSAAERDIHIQTISKTFSVDSKSIKTDVERIIAKSVKEYKQKESQRMHQDSIGYSDKVNTDFIKAPAVAKNEEAVLGLLLVYPEHRKSVFEKHKLSADDFYTEFNKNVFTYIQSTYGIDDYMTDINDVFTSDEVGRITKMKISRMQLSDNGEQVLEDCIQNLKNSIEKKKTQETNTYEGLQALLEKKKRSE